jgi:hypothetical protein
MLNKLEHLIDEVEELDEDLFKKLAYEVGEVDEKITELENECGEHFGKYEELDNGVEYIIDGVLEKINRFRNYSILNGGDTLESLLDELENDLNEVYYGNDE